jgi:hypothetical protein
MEMVAERGVTSSHSTIPRWFQQYVPSLRSVGVATLAAHTSQHGTAPTVSRSQLRRPIPLGHSYNFRSGSAGPLPVWHRAAH